MKHRKTARKGNKQVCMNTCLTRLGVHSNVITRLHQFSLKYTVSRISQ